jgi:hypothetical protein
VRERERALAHLVAELAGGFEKRRPRDAGEDAELERGRVEDALASPPDVCHRPLEHDVAAREEDGVVGSAATGLRLGGHVDRVARRLDAAEEPRSDPAHVGVDPELKRDERDPDDAALIESRRER